MNMFTKIVLIVEKLRDEMELTCRGKSNFLCILDQKMLLLL